MRSSPMPSVCNPLRCAVRSCCSVDTRAYPTSSSFIHPAITLTGAHLIFSLDCPQAGPLAGSRDAARPCACGEDAAAGTWSRIETWHTLLARSTGVVPLGGRGDRYRCHLPGETGGTETGESHADQKAGIHSIGECVMKAIVYRGPGNKAWRTFPSRAFRTRPTRS